MWIQMPTAGQHTIAASHMMFFEVLGSRLALAPGLRARQAPLHHFSSDSR